MSQSDLSEGPPSSKDASAAKGPGGHPPGLYALFFAELWERFNYYGLRGFLVLYLTKYVFRVEMGPDPEANALALAAAEAKALALYATFTALTYFTPLIGGYLADRYLGQRMAVLVGGILMAAGQFTLTSDGLLLQGLALIILGNGFFKPNISTLVGALYPRDDPRRDGAYTIFYMGINVGAFLAPLVCGYLAEKVNWDYGFAAAGVGMIISVVGFYATQTFLGNAGLPPGRAERGETMLRAGDLLGVAAIVGLCAALAVGFVQAYPVYLKPILSPPWLESALKRLMGDSLYDLGIWGWRLLLVAAVCAVLTMLTSRGKRQAGAAEPLTAVDWQRMALILIVTAFATAFWAGFEQAGGTMNLFADKRTDLMGMPASWLQSVNPMFIFLLSPIFAVTWTYLARRGTNPPALLKFALGLILLGVGFLVMKGAETAAGGPAGTGRVGVYWLIGVYFLHTVGELFLSPIGLSLVNRLSPARFASLMMATWFLSNFLANYLAGTMKARMEAWGLNLWDFLAGLGIGAGLLLLMLYPLLKKLAHGRG